jgi:uncharacterized protein YgiM (DUF1202 family)
MKNKQVFVGLVLAMGIMMFGCGTFSNVNARVNGVETETSKMLLRVANEVLLSRESGWAYSVFKVAYESKVDGLRVSMAGLSQTTLSLKYQDRQYTLTLRSRVEDGDVVLSTASWCLDVTPVTSDAAPEAKPTATVTSDALNMRSEPSANGALVKTLKKGDTLFVTGEIASGWVPVEYEGAQGYVSGQYILLSD